MRTSFITLLFLLSIYILPSFTANIKPSSKNLLSAFLSKSKYVIDDVLTLLNNLLANSEKSLTDLDEDWLHNEKIKNDLINTLKDALKNQQNDCSGLIDQRDKLNKDLADLLQKITNYNNRIQEDKDQIVKLLAQRCEVNRNYIRTLKDNKHLLNLLDILRKAVTKFGDHGNNNFLFIKENIINFLVMHQNLKKGIISFASLPHVPDVKKRTDEEIGSGHIDNTQDQIKLDDFNSKTIEDLQSVKTKLLKILDDIENQVKEEMKKFEENEIKSAESTAELKVSLETEIKYLQNLVKKLQEEVINITALLTAKNFEINECQNKETDSSKALEVAIEDYQNSKNSYENQRKNLIQEIADFKEIIELYKNQVASVEEQYKKRTDDYLDDQQFQGEDFSKREIYNQN